jgi:hypothetical protein
LKVASSSPEVTFQILTVLSLEAVASRFPSGDQEMEFTLSL